MDNSKDLEFTRRIFADTSLDVLYQWRNEIKQRLALADQYIAEREAEADVLPPHLETAIWVRKDDPTQKMTGGEVIRRGLVWHYHPIEESEGE